MALYDDIRESLEEVLAHQRGEPLRGKLHHAVPVAAIRERLGITQEDLARLIDASVSTVRAWEQGRRVPTGTARTLLLVLDKEPEAVLRALDGPAAAP